MSQYAELTISLERRGADTFAVEWRLAQPDSDADSTGASEGHRLAIDDLPRLIVTADDALKYGRRLSAELFGIPDLKEALAAAKAVADQMPLRMRLSLSPKDVDLQALRWETLTDPDGPEPGSPLFMGERILFSRFVESPDWRSAPRRAKSGLSALVMVANPKDLHEWAPGGVRLTPIDVQAELARARDGLAGISVTTLGDRDRASLQQATEHLRHGPDVLYLVCHGTLKDGQPQLWLEDDEGNVAATPGGEFVARLRELRQPPRLVVLVSCQSAGAGGDALGALGPRLGEAGVPAVLAFHGDVTMQTAAAFMQVFFREVQRDGQIDQAVARARGAVRDRPDAWSPVLYMRLKSGSLWYEPRFAGDVSGRPYEGWRSLINHIANHNCTPVLGPGLLESLIGPRREIARRWAETYQFPMAPHDQEDLPNVAQYVYVNQKDTTLLRDELRKSLRDGLLRQLGASPSPELLKIPVDDLLLELGKTRWRTDPDEPHWVLAQAPFPVFITTMFDGLLLEALQAAGKEPREEFFRWNEYAMWPASVYDDDPDYIPSPEQPLIYYLFGRLGVENSIVITEDDYFDYLLSAARNSDLIPSEIRRRLAASALLFLGYEMDGWDFRVLFRSFLTYLGNQFSRKKQPRIAHAGVQIDLEEGRILKPERAREYIESYFEESNVHIYWGSVDDFARDLRQQLAGSA